MAERSRTRKLTIQLCSGHVKLGVVASFSVAMTQTTSNPIVTSYDEGTTQFGVGFEFTSGTSVLNASVQLGTGNAPPVLPLYIASVCWEKEFPRGRCYAQV
jgi:hypothetical protein